jgi:type VI secretion system secreted protein VgrG
VANAEGKEADKAYVLTTVQHAAQDWSVVTRDAKPATYSNQFACRPRDVPLRPEMKTPAPRIHGTQTAVVTGPGGEDIYTDKYGRIKVQFHWDRLGTLDERTSCWVRVAQSWAGRNFGAWFLPRIGQEVVNALEEGDPDRPLVVGSVYNAEQMVPFGLPANKTQSGLRTRSSLGGGAANCDEFRFEDRKGSELVTLHAENDLETEVEHDATHWVGHDETTTIDHDCTETVHHNETITVDGDRTEMVHRNETVTIDRNRTHTVLLNEMLTVGVSREHTVGVAEAITVGASQTLEVGRNQSVSVGANQTESVGKDRSVKVGQNDTLDVGKKLTITAGDEIVLQTSDATIIMKKNGDITIKGKKIIIKGSGDVIVKGQKIV